MSILVLAGKVAGTTAIAAGALVAGVHATATTPGATPAADAKKVHCGGAGFGKPNDALKAELKKLRAMPKGDDRRKAAVKLRKDVRAGTYGDASQVASYRREVHRLRLLVKAPDAMRSALRSAAGKPAGEERRAAVLAVWKDAAAGTYGDDVKQAADRVVARAEACAAKRDARRRDDAS